MLDMRLTLPELMAARGLKTAYSLERYAKGALTMSSAHRLVKAAGKPKRVDLATLDALCDVFGVEPGELWERDTKKRKAG